MKVTWKMKMNHKLKPATWSKILRLSCRQKGVTVFWIYTYRMGKMLAKYHFQAACCLWLCSCVRSFILCVQKIKERCQLLYDILRLHLMVPIDFWQDSTPFGWPTSPGWSPIFQGWSPTFFGIIWHYCMTWEIDTDDSNRQGYPPSIEWSLSLGQSPSLGQLPSLGWSPPKG